jgi:hypothetical protein
MNLPPKQPLPPPPIKLEEYPRLFKLAHDQLLFERRLNRWAADSAKGLWILMFCSTFLGAWLLGGVVREKDPVVWNYVALVFSFLILAAMINICVFAIWGAKWHKLPSKPSL